MAATDHLGPQFGTTSATYADGHQPKHSNWTMSGASSSGYVGKRRKGGKSKPAKNILHRPAHAKGATGYTGKHGKTTENS
jgi:hypothetical protein